MSADGAAPGSAPLSAAATRTPRTCGNCHKPGHIGRYCPQLGEGNRLNLKATHKGQGRRIGRTEGFQEMKHHLRVAANDVDAGPLPPRPKCRAECAEVPRPCPYVSCRYNLYLDVTEIGTLKMNWPDADPDEMTESCALDVADNGGITLETVAALVGMTRERIRQIEAAAVERANAAGRRLGLELPAEPVGNANW